MSQSAEPTTLVFSSEQPIQPVRILIALVPSDSHALLCPANRSLHTAWVSTKPLRRSGCGNGWVEIVVASLGEKGWEKAWIRRSGAGILAAGGLHRHLCLPQLVTHSCCCGNSHFDRPTPTPQQNGPGLRDLAMSPVAEVGEGTMKSLPSLNVDFREGKHSRLLIWEVFLAQAMSRRAYKQASADSFFFFTVGGKRLR